jgi:hypothetical protein
MKKAFQLIIVTSALILAIASCSTSTKTHARFGTWNKVSAEKGNWIGVRNLKSTAALGGIPVFKGEASLPDTTAIDTSYIENAGQISMSMTTWGDVMPYVFQLNLIDSTVSFSWDTIHFKYISDSTAITLYPSKGGFGYLGKSPNGYIYKLSAYLVNHCGHRQANKEYAVVDIWNKDSTKHKIYNVRVDGMKKIASSIVACKD